MLCTVHTEGRVYLFMILRRYCVHKSRADTHRHAQTDRVPTQTKHSCRDYRSVPARVCTYTPRSQTLDVNMFINYVYW